MELGQLSSKHSVTHFVVVKEIQIIVILDQFQQNSRLQRIDGPIFLLGGNRLFSSQTLRINAFACLQVNCVDLLWSSILASMASGTPDPDDAMDEDSDRNGRPLVVGQPNGGMGTSEDVEASSL